MRARFFVLHSVLMLTSCCWLQFAWADFSDKPVTQPPQLVQTPAPTKARGSSPQSGQGKSTGATNNNSVPSTRGSSSSQNGPAGDPAFEHDSSAPVVYSADSGSGSRKDGTMELIKNVVITQAETTMWADRAELFSVPGTTRPKRVLAKGRVKLKKKPNAQGIEINATADEIEYFADTQKAILRGRPVIQKGKEILRGEQIEVDMVTEAIKVKNPSGVVDPKAQNNSNAKPPGK